MVCKLYHLEAGVPLEEGQHPKRGSADVTQHQIHHHLYFKKLFLLLAPRALFQLACAAFASSAQKHCDSQPTIDRMPTLPNELPAYTALDVAKHNTADDAWLIIGGKVYDVTHFAQEHPGGDDVLFDAAGEIRSRSAHQVVLLKTLTIGLIAITE